MNLELFLKTAIASPDIDASIRHAARSHPERMAEWVRQANKALAGRRKNGCGRPPAVARTHRIIQAEPDRRIRHIMRKGSYTQHDHCEIYGRYRDNHIESKLQAIGWVWRSECDAMMPFPGWAV